MGRKETQGWVIFVVGVLLVAAVFAGVRSGRLNLSGLNIGGSGSNDESAPGGTTVPESLDWQVLCSPYDYVVQTDGVLYWAESDGHKLWASDNKTDVFDRAQTALGSGTIFSNGVSVPAMTLQDDILIIESYQGRIKVHSNLGQWLLPQRASDPSTAGWGSAEKGRMWFNTAEGKIKFWDGSAIQVLPSVSGSVTGSYVLETKYTIWHNSTDSKYYAEDEFGNIDYSGVNAPTVINNALGALTVGRTWIETVILKGNFSIPANDPIDLTSWTLLDLRQANLHLAADSDTAIIQNADQTNGNTMMMIEGGRFNGNQPNQSGHVGARGIFINNNNQDMNPSDVIFIDGAFLYNFYGNGIDLRLNTGDSLKLDHTDVRGVGGGIDCTWVAFNLTAGDSRINTISAGSYRENLIIRGGTFLIENSYFGGSSVRPTVYIDGDYRAQFVNCLVDDNRMDAWYVHDSYYITFTGCRVRQTSSITTTNTYDGWVIDSSFNCSLSNCYAGRYDTSTTKWLRYGIYENGTSNYNMITGTNCYDVGTFGIRTVGALTKVACSWNGTTWIS